LVASGARSDSDDETDNTLLSTANRRAFRRTTMVFGVASLLGDTLMGAIYTARIDYERSDRLDITRKSGCSLGKVFAPSWAILGPAIAARRMGTESAESWAEYEREYLKELRASYRTQRQAWTDLLGRQQVTLCCYCNLNLVGDRCHRLLLADVLTKLGATYAGER
jgi:uncharacterized protein YeaO (DUF488 family)